MKTQKVIGIPLMCFKMKVAKTEGSGKVQELSMESQIDAIFYVNICYADGVLPPLLENNELANQDDDSTWKLIPFSFSKKQEDSNLKPTRIFMDMFVNSAINSIVNKKPAYLLKFLAD